MKRAFGHSSEVSFILPDIPQTGAGSPTMKCPQAMRAANVVGVQMRGQRVRVAVVLRGGDAGPVVVHQAVDIRWRGPCG